MTAFTNIIHLSVSHICVDTPEAAITQTMQYECRVWIFTLSWVYYLSLPNSTLENLPPTMEPCPWHPWYFTSYHYKGTEINNYLNLHYISVECICSFCSAQCTDNKSFLTNSIVSPDLWASSRVLYMSNFTRPGSALKTKISYFTLKPYPTFTHC